MATNSNQQEIITWQPDGRAYDGSGQRRPDKDRAPGGYIQHRPIRGIFDNTHRVGGLFPDPGQGVPWQPSMPTVTSGGTSGGNPYDMPGETEFYDQLAGRARRNIYAALPGLQNSFLTALQGRGLGQSSEVGRGLSGLMTGLSGDYAQALGEIQGQQYAARQQRYMSYLNYLYNRKMLDAQSDQGIWGFLENIGSAIPWTGIFKGRRQGNGSGGGSGEPPSNQPPIGPDDNYRGGP